MSNEIERLHTGKFVELRRVIGDGFKYEYLHEQRCEGHIVSVLPIHYERGMLIRKELTPCWGEGPHLNSLTGGWERAKHETPIDTVIEEMHEEAGIIIKDERCIYSLGTCHGSKSSDNTYHLFLVDLSDDNFDEVDVAPDSHLESLETSEWVPLVLDSHRGNLAESYEWLMDAADPLLYVMFTRWFIANGHRPITREHYLGEEE